MPKEILQCRSQIAPCPGLFHDKGIRKDGLTAGPDSWYLGDGSLVVYDLVRHVRSMVRVTDAAILHRFVNVPSKKVYLINE